MRSRNLKKQLKEPNKRIKTMKLRKLQKVSRKVLSRTKSETSHKSLAEARTSTSTMRTATGRSKVVKAHLRCLLKT